MQTPFPAKSAITLAAQSTSEEEVMHNLLDHAQDYIHATHSKVRMTFESPATIILTNERATLRLLCGRVRIRDVVSSAIANALAKTGLSAPSDVCGRCGMKPCKCSKPKKLTVEKGSDPEASSSPRVSG